MTNAIKITDLSFSIAKKEILKNISLKIAVGDCLGFLGPNGAGKSTLLKCLMRINRGILGRIEINGRLLDSYSQRELAAELAYVPQLDGRSLSYTAREFVEMGRYPHIKPFYSMTKEDRAKVDEALCLTDVKEFEYRRLMTLSGGERQSVFVAAALAQGAKILLLDEPTTFLDPKHQSDTLKLLKRLNDTLNLTIVIVTHNINSAAMISSRIVALKEGEIAFLGSGNDLMQNGVLEKIYGMKFVFAQHPQSGAKCVVP